MKIRVLGCSGAIVRDSRTSAFLVDDDLLVDAGTGVGDLSLQEMLRVEHVLLTHSHFDHVAALPMLVDTIATTRVAPLHVHALGHTIEALRAHVFNEVIWPDFTRIPSAEAPLVRFSEIAVGQRLTFDSRQVEVLPAVHTVPAVGFAVSAGQGAWVFTGDTERNPAFWRRVNALDVRALVIETAFSNREAALASASLHLSPQTLAEELSHIAEGRRYPIYVAHAKPAEVEHIMAEIEALRRTLGRHGAFPLDLRWLQNEQVFEL